MKTSECIPELRGKERVGRKEKAFTHKEWGKEFCEAMGYCLE